MWCALQINVGFCSYGHWALPKRTTLLMNARYTSPIPLVWIKKCNKGNAFLDVQRCKKKKRGNGVLKIEINLQDHLLVFVLCVRWNQGLTEKTMRRLVQGVYFVHAGCAVTGIEIRKTTLHGQSVSLSLCLSREGECLEWARRHCASSLYVAPCWPSPWDLTFGVLPPQQSCICTKTRRESRLPRVKLISR